MIWLDSCQHMLRVIDGDPSDKPPYRAVGNVFLFGDVAILTGFLGTFKREDIREIYKTMQGMGVKNLLAERVGDHGFPFGEKISCPGEPFHGWWRVKFDNDKNQAKT